MLISYFPAYSVVRMKNLLSSALVVTVFIFEPALASGETARTDNQTGGLGVGAVIGSPTAITGKKYLNSSSAIDFGISFFASDYTLLYADYLIHFHGIIKTSGLEQVQGYLGIGGLLAYSNNSRSSVSGYLGTSQGSIGLGVRVPFGLLWPLPTAPVEFFGEIAPGISVIPSTSMLIEIGIGARFFFR